MGFMVMLLLKGEYVKTIYFSNRLTLGL